MATAQKREEFEVLVPLANTVSVSLKIDKLKSEKMNDLGLVTPGSEATTHTHSNPFLMRGTGTNL